MGLWLQRLKRDRSASASNGSAGPRTVRSVLTPAAQPTSSVDGMTLSNSVDTSPQATDDILLDDLEIAEEKSPAGHNNTIGTGIAQTPNWNNATSSSAATRHQPDNSSACLPWGASRSLPDNSSSTSMVASNAPGCPSSTDLPAGGMPANTLSSNGFQPLSLASTNCFSHDGVCEQTDAKADVVGSRDDVATLYMLKGPSSRHSECSNPGVQPGDWFNGMPGSLVSVQSNGFPSIAAAARSNSGTSQLSSLFGSTSDVHLPYCSIRSAECQHGGSRPYSQHRSEDMTHSDSRAHCSAAHREVRSAQTWSAAGRTSAHTVHATHAGHGDSDRESPCSGGGRLLAALMPPVYQLPVVQEAATGDYEQDALSATAVHGEYSDMLPHTSMLQSSFTEPALDALPLSGIISLDAYLSALLADSGRRKMLFFTKAQLDVQACHAVAAFLMADAAASQAVRVVALPACGITDQGMSALADGLAVSSGVCLLDLSANALGDTGATSVAMVIVAQQQLGHVRLAGNHFGEEGVAALAAAARLNPNMTKLSIKGIKAPNARLKELHAACTANAECIARQASLHAEGPMGSAFARAQHGHMPLHTASTKHSPRPAFGRVSAPAEHAQTGKQTHQAGGKHRPHSSSRLTVTPRLWSGTALPACTSADNTSPTGCMDPTQMAAARLEGKRASGTQASAAAPGSVPAAPYPLPCTHSSGLMLGQQQYSSLQSVVRLLAQPALAVEHAAADIISRALMEDCAVAAQLQPSAMAAEGPGSDPELDGLGHALAASHAAMEGQWRVECTVSTGGGAGNECLRNLRHTFLRVSMGAEQHVHHAGIDGDSSSGTADAASYHAPWPGSHMVIDPRFAEQFEVSNPTLRYEAVLAWLPRVFVGCAERLPLLVAVLCNEMEQCFKARGIALPPWREPGALITKWMPKPHLSAGHTSQSAAARTLQ